MKDSLYILIDRVVDMATLLEKILVVLDKPIPEKVSRTKPRSTDRVHIVKSWAEIELEEDDYLITIGDALLLLKVVRSTLFNLRKDGLIKEFKKGRSVRFRFSEIKEAVGWYSLPKGK